jgi:hypothetical protein
MHHTLEVTTGLTRDELDQGSRYLRGQSLCDVITEDHTLTIVCGGCGEVLIRWGAEGPSYTGYRSSLKAFDRPLAIPEPFRGLLGQVLDSFQVVEDRGYLVLESGDALKIVLTDTGWEFQWMRTVSVVDL